MKKIPNPFGKKGKKDHQDKIKDISDEIDAGEFNVNTETGINLTNGKKRFADVTASNDDGKLEEIHQVGRTNKNGTPVKRERDAIADIEEATSKKVTFHGIAH